MTRSSGLTAGWIENGADRRTKMGGVKTELVAITQRMGVLWAFFDGVHE
jgi:hypothetical protein